MIWLGSVNSFNSRNIDLQDWWCEKNVVVLKIQFLIWKIMILFSDAPHTVDTCYIIIIMFQAPFVSTVSPSVWKMWTSHSVCRNAKLRKFQHGHSSVCSAPGERLQAFLDQRFRSRWSGTLFICSPQSSVYKCQWIELVGFLKDDKTAHLT